MSHFYGTVQGNSGLGSKGGSKDSSMTIYCASSDGAIRCHAYVDHKGRDRVRVEKTTWQGKGKSMLIYNGPIG